MVTTFHPLDKYLVETGKVATLPRAQELILNGSVRVNGAVITAPICPVYFGHLIEIDGVDGPWVSPLAIKLHNALETLGIDIRGRIAVDIGAGAGGFTEVLIQRGAKKVYAVDKEFGLLHPSLSLSDRVKNIQRVNAADLTRQNIDSKFDLIVTDIGAENLDQALSPIIDLMDGAADILCFIEEKTLGKKIENFLRLEKGFLIKKVPDTLQKESGLIWAYKKA